MKKKVWSWIGLALLGVFRSASGAYGRDGRIAEADGYRSDKMNDDHEYWNGLANIAGAAAAAGAAYLAGKKGRVA